MLLLYPVNNYFISADEHILFSGGKKAPCILATVHWTEQRIWKSNCPESGISRDSERLIKEDFREGQTGCFFGNIVENKYLLYR